MNSFWAKKLFLYVKRKIKNFSYHKAIVFVICLGLSSFLWLLSSLEKRYTSRISVPVNYVDFPKDKQLSGALPQKFDLLVDAYGYTLLSYKLRLAFSPVLINVSELIDNPYDRGSRYRYFVSTVNHKEEIEKQISSEIKILSIKPDSLEFNFSRVISKRVAVRPNLNLTVEKEYALEKEPFTIPGVVLVSGPQHVLDTLKFIATAPRSYSNLSRSMEETIDLQPVPGLELDVSEVRLSVPVEQNTEVTLEIPIEVINQPDDVVLKIFPGKVKVTCRIGLSKYKKLDNNSFRAYVNYEKITLKEARLPVSFESLSKIELSANYSPKEVEYILEREK